jgi:hypothetical protein
LIGHWAHRSAPAFEQSEFRRANDGKSFEEAQHILRLRGNQGFLMVILPHRRNEAPADSVSENAGTITVKTGDETITFDENSWTFRGPQGAGAGLFGSGTSGAGEYGMSGGPGEVFQANGQTAATLHGAAGPRTVRWPGGERVLEYGGGKPSSVALTAN